MNFVQQYYDFKSKWYYKIGSLLFDFYISKDPNNQIEKMKYDYLEDLIYAYINKEEIDERKIEHKLNTIDSSNLNKLEYEILKYVIYIREEYKSVQFNSTDYIYFSMLLEIIIRLYNGAFQEIDEKFVYNILKENLFRFEFVDFKRKQTKMNVLLKYLKYISKNENYFFSNLKNRNIKLTVTALSYHRNYFVVDIENKLDSLIKYDEDLVSSVEKNNDYGNKLFILNFNVLVEQIVYLLEKEKFTIDKVIFNLDKYKYNREAINYINNYDSVINKYIMFCSQDKKKLEIINSKYSKCVFIREDKIDKPNEFTGMNVLVKNSFWNKHKADSKKYQELNFITISNNIVYKFEREEI